MSKTFDPNAAADPNAGIYGLPHSFKESEIIFIPIPWEATTSYGGGTAYAPNAVLEASKQLDLFDLEVHNPYEKGMHILPIDPAISKLNKKAKTLAQPIKDVGGNLTGKPKLKNNLKEVNLASAQLNKWINTQTSKILKSGKIPGILGGDHSVPFGALQAAAEYFGEFGIIHFDAHSDTRFEYMGFKHSHASIMRNAGEKLHQISKIVQVGIRDFCQEEYDFIQSQNGKFEVFYDQQLTRAKLNGESFGKIAERIVSSLPKNVWVSFDIDGLDPRYCPHTGTPVPGGLDYAEAVHILYTLANSGRRIIGFDLVEVAPPLNSKGKPVVPLQASDEWDANVGMRLLYKLAAYSLASQGKANWRC